MLPIAVQTVEERRSALQEKWEKYLDILHENDDVLAALTDNEFEQFNDAAMKAIGLTAEEGLEAMMLSLKVTVRIVTAV